jgi:F420-0:gamma-glutamyl ligase
MADRYLLESSAVDGYLLEDGTGIILLDGPTVKVITDVLQIVESILRIKHLFKVLTDMIQTVESVLKVRSLTRVFTDVVQTVETLIRRLAFVRVTSEALQLVESTLRLKRIRQVVNETVSTVESVLKFIVTTVVKKGYAVAARISREYFRRIRKR